MTSTKLRRLLVAVWSPSSDPPLNVSFWSDFDEPMVHLECFSIPAIPNLVPCDLGSRVLLSVAC